MPHLSWQVNTGGGVVAVKVEVSDDGGREPREELGSAQTQAAQEAQHHQHGAVHGQDRRRHHGIAAPVTHHPDDARPDQHSEGQPVVVGDAPHLGAYRKTSAHTTISLHIQLSLSILKSDKSTSQSCGEFLWIFFLYMSVLISWFLIPWFWVWVSLC